MVILSGMIRHSIKISAACRTARGLSLVFLIQIAGIVLIHPVLSQTAVDLDSGKRIAPKYDQANGQVRRADRTEETGPGTGIHGVYWRRPLTTSAALQDLVEMQSAGIRAVRTQLPIPGPLYSVADSMGIYFFRDLPLNDYSPSRLVDSLEFVQSLVRESIETARDHPSAGPIGLAVRPDTRSELTCSWLRDVRSGTEGYAETQYYYVGVFVENDMCAGEVDFVLLDGLDSDRPSDLLRRWRASQTTPVGLASVGWYVLPGASAGVDEEHSAQWQARRLETALTALTSSAREETFFVYRWRDYAPRDGEDYSERDPYYRRYGLYDSADMMRPATNVVQGIFTGARTVFAFPERAEYSSVFPWFTLLGWVLIVMVVVLYASGPRFRYMMPRYFFAHGFFRNAVREAREVLPIVSTALLTVVGLSSGMLGALALETVADTAPALAIARMLPETAHGALTAMLSRPILPTIFIGSVSLLGMAIWMGVWMMVAIRKSPLLPSQALMLAVWPKWQLVVLIPAAMAIATLGPGEAIFWILILLPVWGMSSFWSTVRTAYDLMKISGCSPLAAILIWLVNPVLLLGLAVAAWIFLHSDESRYLWHLAGAG
jgi:hypothetical protein